MSWSKLERLLKTLADEHGMILFEKDGWGTDNGESVTARSIACYYPDPEKIFVEIQTTTRNAFYEAAKALKVSPKLRVPNDAEVLDITSPVLFLGCSLALGCNNIYEVVCAINIAAAQTVFDEWKAEHKATA